MSLAYEDAIKRLTEAVERRRRVIAARRALIERETALLAQDEHALAVEEHLVKIARGDTAAAGLDSIDQAEPLRRRLETAAGIRDRALCVLEYRGKAATRIPDIIATDLALVLSRSPLKPNSLSSVLCQMADKGIVVGDGHGNWWIEGNQPAAMPVAQQCLEPAAKPSADRTGDENADGGAESPPRIAGARRLYHTEQRILANELARKPVPGGRGGNRLPTMLEIQREIMSRLGIDRRKAQSATRRAVEHRKKSRDWQQ